MRGLSRLLVLYSAPRDFGGNIVHAVVESGHGSGNDAYFLAFSLESRGE